MTWATLPNLNLSPEAKPSEPSSLTRNPTFAVGDLFRGGTEAIPAEYLGHARPPTASEDGMSTKSHSRVPSTAGDVISDAALREAQDSAAADNRAREMWSHRRTRSGKMDTGAWMRQRPGATAFEKMQVGI